MHFFNLFLFSRFRRRALDRHAERAAADSADRVLSRRRSTRGDQAHRLLRRALRALLRRARLARPAAAVDARSSAGRSDARDGDDLVVVADTGEMWSGDSAWLMVLWALADYRQWSYRLASPLLLPTARGRCSRRCPQYRGSLSCRLGLTPDERIEQMASQRHAREDPRSRAGAVPRARLRRGDDARHRGARGRRDAASPTTTSSPRTRSCWRSTSARRTSCPRCSTTRSKDARLAPRLRGDRSKPSSRTSSRTAASSAR